MVLVELAPRALGFGAALVAAHLLQSSQLASGSNFDTLGRNFVSLYLGHVAISPCLSTNGLSTND
jgi:hypothetical protein